MKNIKIHSLFFSFLILISLIGINGQAYAQTFNFGLSGSGKGGSSCGGKDCSNATCQLTTSGGKLSQNCPEGKRNDVDTACIMNRNAQSCSCLDTMPVANIKRVAETNCYRANGAGGNPKPRNHLGTDYSADAGTVVTAAADGNIVWAKPLGGGGRAIMIEHTKSCGCSANKSSGSCDNKYVTVYLHLKDYIKTGGSVKKGDPIAHVGGSNYHSASNTLCDYPNPDGPCHPYGPHLHFEIHSGDFSKGYNTIKSSIIDPLCGDIQSFCGGGSEDYSTEGCLNKKPGDERETLSDEAKKDKTVTNVAGITETPSGEGMAQTTNEDCDWHQYMPDKDTCYFCPIFKVLFNTSSALAQKTYQSLSEGITYVVIIFFALWVGVFVLKNIAALEAVKPGKMLQELLIQAFRVLLVVLILRVSYAHVLKLTLAPVFNTGMAYAQTISGTTSCSGSYMNGLMGYEKELTDKSQGALPLSMGQNILCAIKSMQDGVWKIVAFGKEVMCIGLHIKKIIMNMLPNPGYVISGIVLMIGGLLLVLAFPWCLVDCVLNMAIASALMPAAIGAWAFPKQASYLKKLWDYFMNAMFQFVFLSIILYIILQATQDLLSGLDAYATDYDKIVSARTGLAFWGVSFIKLMTICLLGWVFLDKGTELAKEFADAPNLDIGKKTGGFFAQAAERVALGSKDPDTGKRKGGILGAAKEVGSLGKLAAKSYIATPIREHSIARKMANVKKNGQAIKDKDGKIIGYQLDVGQGQGKGSGLIGHLRPHKTTRFAMINPDGSMSYSEQTHSIKGQIKQAAQGLVNQGRLSHTLSNTAKAEDLLNGKFEDGQIRKTSADGKTRQIFNKKGKLLRTLTEDENGNITMTNAKGEIIAKKSKDADGNIVISRRNHSGGFNNTVFDGNHNLLKADVTHHNLRGEQVTLNITQNENGGYDMNKTTASLRARILASLAPKDSKLESFANAYGMKSETDLSGAPQSQNIVHKGAMMAVRDVTDANGNVVHRDFAFKTDADKYIVRRDGTLDMDLIQNLQSNSGLGSEMVNEAILHTVMNDRHIGLANTFQSRETIHQDGKTIITQKNNDGSQTVVTSEIQNGQMLIHMRTVDGNGNITQITDNGVIRRTTTQQVGKEAVSHYNFNEHTLNRSSVQNLMNFGGKFGQLAPSIDQEAAMWGLTDEDRQAFAKQEQERRNQPNKHEKTTLEEFLNFAIQSTDEIEQEEQRRSEYERRLQEARQRWEGTDEKPDQKS